MTTQDENEALRQRILELERANQTLKHQLEREIATHDYYKSSLIDFVTSFFHLPALAIYEYSQLLQAQLEGYGSLNDKQIAVLHQIEKVALDFKYLLDRLKIVSELQSRKIQLEITSISPHELCQDCLQHQSTVHNPTLQIEIQNGQKAFSIDIDERVEIVQADKKYLKCALIELLNNAIGYTPTGGQLGIEITPNLDQKVVNFVVWDTGTGISENQLHRIYKLFGNYDPLSRHSGGIGLGLGLVGLIAELHKGQVSVESKIGKGSRFTITFPWSLSQRPS